MATINRTQPILTTIPGSGAEHRERHAAMLADRTARMAEARRDAERARLIGELGSIQPEEDEPDPRHEAWAQAGAVLALTVGAEVAAQALLSAAPLWVRAFAFVAGVALGAGLAGAMWNTHVARRTFWRPLAWAWGAVWLVGLLASLGAAGLTAVASFGAGAALLVSMFAAAVAFSAAIAAAHHVDAVAARHQLARTTRHRREAIALQLEALDRSVPSARGATPTPLL